MDEELLGILGGRQKPEDIRLGGANPQEAQANLMAEMEITPELRQTNTVVNPRKQGRFQGVTNFLANPEAQMALLSFGRAFAKNQPGQAGTILADAGEGFLRAQADSRALKAAESGEDIAESGGTFADSSLVSQLQGRRQEAEVAAANLGMDTRRFREAVRQFNANLNLEKRKVELQELGADQDILLRNAALNLNEEQFEQTLQLKKRDQEMTKVMNDLQGELWKAQAEQLSGSGERSAINMATQVTRYIEALNTQEQVLLERKDIADRQIRALSGNTFRGYDETGKPIIDTEERIIRVFGLRDAHDPVHLQNREKLVKLYTELKATEDRIAQIRADRDYYAGLQVSNLGESGDGEGTNPPSPAPGTNPPPGSVPSPTSSAGKPEGTLDSPIAVSTIAEARSKTPGSYITVAGQVYIVGEGGELIDPNIE